MGNLSGRCSFAKDAPDPLFYSAKHGEQMLILTRKENQETVIVVPPCKHTQIIRHRQLERRGDGCRMAWVVGPMVEVYREEILPSNLEIAEKGKVSQ